jgi:hypothetical protein
MSVSTIITGGFGSGGSPSFIITDGYSIGTAVLNISPLSILSMELGGGLSKSINFSGNELPISVATTAPTTTPSNGKGIVFVVSGGTLVIYGWNGSNWVHN